MASLGPEVRNFIPIDLFNILAFAKLDFLDLVKFLMVDKTLIHLPIQLLLASHSIFLFFLISLS